MLPPTNGTSIPAILSVSTSKVIVIVGIFSELTMYIQTDSDIWVHQLPNIAHRWSQHSPATLWLMSEWPCNVIPLPETFTLMGDIVCCSDAGSHYQMAGAVDKGRETAWQTPISSIIKTIWSVLQVIRQCFWSGERMVGVACVSFLSHQLVLSTPMLTGIKQTPRRIQRTSVPQSPTISIFSSIHTTKTSAPTSNATNHSSIHLINTTTTNNTRYKTKNG